jgi:hypothetical protein
MFWNSDSVKTTAHAQVESVTKLSMCCPQRWAALFFWGCAFARMLPFFIRPLALDCNDFKFASALSAIPL